MTGLDFYMDLYTFKCKILQEKTLLDETYTPGERMAFDLIECPNMFESEHGFGVD